MTLILVNYSEFSSYLHVHLSNMAVYVERLDSYTNVLHSKKIVTVIYQAIV